MLHSLKKRLYFVVAAYFAFWAKIMLRRWQPRIVVITGSSGKTTVLHLVEAQVGKRAIYSHHANSSIGIPFHILGMNPNVLSRAEWPGRFLLAPIKALRKLPPSDLYIVEADCDRPHEGEFLAKLLQPEVVVWVSVYRTHSMNFDGLVKGGAFPTHEAAIAYEFGNFVAATTKLVIANGDQPALVSQLSRAAAGVAVKRVHGSNMKDYRITASQTLFTVAGQAIGLPGLHPKELGISLQLVNELLTFLDVPLDSRYTRLHMPPGRSSVFAGKKDTVLVDSTYNTGLGAMTALIELFQDFPSKTKWLVLGDILEQGSVEQEEHEKLARVIAKAQAQQVILLGPRTKKYTYPLMKRLVPDIPIVAFENPKEVLDFLNANLKGHEAILFKGARGLEGVIDQLLADPTETVNLVRREQSWVKYRKSMGLPR